MTISHRMRMALIGLREYRRRAIAAEQRVRELEDQVAYLRWVSCGVPYRR